MQEDPRASSSLTDERPGAFEASWGRLTNTLWVVTALLMIPTAAASVYRATQTGWRHLYLLHIVLVAVLSLALLLRRRLRIRVGAIVLLGALFLAGCGGLGTFGLVGSARLILVAVAVMAAIIYGTRAGVVVVAANLVAMSGVALAVLRGWTVLDFDIEGYAMAPSSWVSAIMGSTALSALLVAASSALRDSFVASIRSLESRSAELQEANVALRQEIGERKRAEEALRAGETRYRTLFEGGGDGILILKDSRFVECNQRALEIYGASREQLIGGTPVGFSPPLQPDGRPSAEKAAEVIQAALAGSRQQFEWRHRRHDGTPFVAEVTLDSLELDGEHCLLAHVQDVSESRRAEATLQSVFRAAPIGIGLVVDRVFTQVNDRLCQMLGYSRTELIGRGSEILYPTREEYESVGREYARVHETGSTTLEVCWKTKDGRVIDVLLTVAPLDPAESSAGVTFAALDVTERNRAERALRESDRRYRDLIERTDSLVTQVDGEGRYVFLNEAAARLLGASASQLAGRLARDFVHPDDRRRAADAFAQWQREQRTNAAFEGRQVSASGAVHHVLWNVSLQYDEAGQLFLVNSIGRDISEQKRAEKALRESEDRYRSLVERASDGVIMIQDGLVRFCNTRMAEMFGFTVAELIDTPFLDLVHPDERSRVAEIHRGRLRGEDVPTMYELGARHRDGAWLDIETNSGVITLDGRPATLSFVRDIRERKRAEAALREHQETIQALVETSKDWIWAIDLNGVHTYCNPAVEAILGYAPEELMGKSSLPLMHEEDRREIESRLPEWIARKSGWSNVAVRWRHKDGSWRHLESNAVPMLGPAGEMAGFRGVDRDVTERRQAEEALRRSEEKYRHLVEDASDIIYTLDLDRRITYISPSVERVMGYAPAEVTGHSFEEYVLPEDLPAIRERLPKILSGISEPQEYRVRAKSGQPRWVRSSSRAVTSGGRPVGLQGILTDVTERRLAEEAAERQREELARADKMIALGTLVSGVAHEINNPNHFMLLNLPILRAAWKDVQPLLERHAQEDPELQLANLPYDEMRHEIPQLIEEVLQGAERIKFIVSELRGYARPHSASKAAVAINDVVRSAVALIANTVNKKTSRFSVSYGKGLPEIRGNLRRLEQVVLNLILNACQALESKDKAVRVRTSHDPGAGRVVVAVEDEGRGISEADLGRILNPFYTTRRDDGGTGLGLAVAARIVDEHEGRLSYESELGKGTLARLSLPVYRRKDET